MILAMSNQSDKPAHLLVTDAGFGKAVEAKGFRKVGSAHWRLDGEGIVWRVAITPGSVLIDQSFEVVQGVYVEGLDDRFFKLRGRRKSRRLGKTSTRAHSWTTLLQAIVYGRADELQAAYEKELSKWKSEMGFWKFLPFKPQKPNYRKESWKIPYMRSESRVAEKFYFTLESGPIEEIASYLVSHWEKSMYLDIMNNRDINAVYRNVWGAGTRAANFGSDIAFAAAKLVGDDAQIESMADKFFERAQQPVSFFFARIVNIGHIGWISMNGADADGTDISIERERNTPLSASAKQSETASAYSHGQIRLNWG